MPKVKGSIGGLAALISAAALCSAAPAAAEPAHYAVKADITPALSVSAVVRITLPPEEVGREAAFVIADRFVLRTVDGGPDHPAITYETANVPLKNLRKVIFHFPTAPDHPVTFTFAYAGPLDTPDDKTHRVRQDVMELGLEEGWFPFRQDLGLQFTADADITGVPAAMTVVAQGQVQHVGDRVILHRASTDFDLPIVAATGLKRAVAPDFEIYARNLDDPFVRIYLKNARPAFEYYNKLYGPFTAPRPIRMVIVPRGGGGYERRSFISTGDGAEDLKANPHFDEFGPARHIAHEIAHAWWWNVPPQTEDYWMVESMAEFSALRYIREAYGEAAFKVLLDRKREAAQKAGPVLTGAAAHKPNSAVLYQKGPLLLFELEDRIGRPTMDRFLGVIGRNPPHTTAEFERALAGVAGEEVARDFDAKLRT